MTRWQTALIAGAVLLIATAGAMKALQPTATRLIVRTVPLGEINLPFAEIVDSRAGRAIIATSPQGSVPICRLFVLDMTSGAVLGNVPIGTSPLELALDKRRGHIFVSSGNTGRGRVYMVDVRNGALLHTATVGSFPGTMAVDERTARLFVVNGNIYNDQDITNNTGSVSILDSRSGHVLRTVTVGRLPGEALVDTRTGRVLVVNTGSKSISVLDARSGRVLHTIAIAETPNAPGPIAVDEQTGRAFALGGNRMFVIDIAEGRVPRSVQTGAATDVTVDERAGRVLVASPTNNTVSVLDAASGKLLHAVHLAGPTWITTVEPGGYALVDARRVEGVLDSVSGRVRYTIPLDAYGGVAPDGRDARLFAINSDSVRVLDARNGRLLRTLTFGLKPSRPGADQMFAPLSLAVDETAGLAFVTDYIHRQISSLDPRSGAILRTATVPLQPAYTLINDRTGHALLVSLGGTESVPDRWDWVPGWLRRRLPFLPSPGARTRVVPGGVSVLDTSR